jgi:hypothetical protein
MFESSSEQIRELLDSLYGELKNFLAHSAVQSTAVNAIALRREADAPQ